MSQTTTTPDTEQQVRLEAGPVILEGNLSIPEGARGVVLFAHGSGSGRHSPRNRYVARRLHEAGLATLLIELLTKQEERADQFSYHLRFDIGLLANRLVAATDWLIEDTRTASLPIGYFGASTGAGAALVAAAERPDDVSAVVSRGGRPDLAGQALLQVRAATLFIVGGDDEPVIGLNRDAFHLLRAPVKELIVIPGASHLFEEPGTLERVGDFAAQWFTLHLQPRGSKDD